MNKTAYVRFFAACSIPAILLTVTVMLPAGAATFTVSNNNDSGAGSFRQAILDVNAQTTGDHRIGFSGGLILGPLTGLPVLTYTGGRVTIHGNESTLDGRSLWNTEPGLRTSATTTIKYLTINNFPSHGLYITGSDCVVIGCRMRLARTTTIVSAAITITASMSFSVKTSRCKTIMWVLVWSWTGSVPTAGAAYLLWCRQVGLSAAQTAGKAITSAETMAMGYALKFQAGLWSSAIIAA